ncbi:MAG: AAA-like domain-containing protein [Blastocatellia bacterium]
MPDLLHRVQQLFDEVVEQDPSERRAFIAEACGGDDEVRRIVEELVAAHERAATFLERPPLPRAGVIRANQPQTPFPPKPEELITPGQKLKNRYLIEKEIDRGGIGVVYLARDEQLVGKQVVVKLLLNLSPESNNAGWFRKKFDQEKEALARINHPGIVYVLDAGELEGRPFIVMEFVNGVTLRSIFKSGMMDLARVARVVRQTGHALSAAHDKGVYHRDLKPENIMLQDLGEGDEQVKLIDFGIATVKDSQLAANREHTRVAGTLPYMAPEQLQGNPSASSDIFSLGVIAYEMITGTVPFRADHAVPLYRMQQDGVRVKPSELCAGLPAAADAIILKALAFDSRNRYRRARDFSDELSRVLLSVSPTVLLTENTHTTEIDDSPGVSKLENMTTVAGLRVMILYKRDAQPDEQLVKLIEEQLREQGCEVFIDRYLPFGIEWAKELERRLRSADVVIPLLSASSVMSEMLAYEVQIAHESAQQQGKPRLFPIRVNYNEKLPNPLGVLLDPIQYAQWTGSQDDGVLISGLLTSFAANEQYQRSRMPIRVEPVGGAVPPDSEFYIVRPTDEEFQSAIARRDSIVLVKGARQMGKSSLLARGLKQARESGASVVLTDFQALSGENLSSADALFHAFAEIIAEQLDLEFAPDQHWKPYSSASVNFARFLRREILGRIETHLVWGLDEVDRLFTCDFGSEVFGLFRSWHNARALDTTAPWHKLTLAIAYATEAHLFITDVNQSPFNVGTRLALDDFTFEQVAELNHHYDYPLGDRGELARFFSLVGGQPYLVRRGLDEMARRKLSLNEFEARADRDEGPFGDHLRRILVLLVQNEELCDVVRGVLGGQPCSNAESFYRLRSAGVMSGDSAEQVRPRCRLYASYLQRHLL